jgi:hypothetical protein
VSDFFLRLAVEDVKQRSSDDSKKESKVKRLVLGAMATTFTFLLLLTAPPAQAVTIQPDLCLGSANSCPGPNPTLGIYDFPWITAVFEDIGAGSVSLTMTASLVENEKLHFWYFNLVPALNPDSLVFTPVSGADVVSGIDTGADGFTRAGAGSFDIEFTFNQGDTANFDNNDVIVYTITCPGCVGFSASSFDVLNPPDPGNAPYIDHETGAVSHGPFRTLAQLTATGDWIAGVGGRGVSVPEPATVLLLGAGLTGLGLVARKRSRKD